MVIIVMGVTGCGKTAVGERLAAALGSAFAEGDSFHSPANVEKMRSGTPLTDEDRWPWLEAIAAEIDRRLADGRGLVVSCSALRRAYRDILMGGRADVLAVHLKGTPELIAGRLAARKGHYMPAALLESQFDTLEEPDETENALTVGIDGTPDEIVADVHDRLKARGVA